MRVEIKGNVYGMSRKEYKRFLKIASKALYHAAFMRLKREALLLC